VHADASVKPFEIMGLEISTWSAHPNSPVFTTTKDFTLDYDNVPASASVDSFDSDINVWTPSGDGQLAIWSKRQVEQENRAWHGADPTVVGTAYLESPRIDVANDQSFVMKFQHRHSFSSIPKAGGGMANADGGLIEISTDDGQTWEDISRFGDPSYGGPIYATAADALNFWSGYVGTNSSFPAMDTVEIDMGKALAGKQVRVRFGVVGAGDGSDLGWDIDDVIFAGIMGTPFPTAVANRALCEPVRLPDFSVESPGETPKSASGSSDPHLSGQGCSFSGETSSPDSAAFVLMGLVLGAGFARAKSRTARRLEDRSRRA
jgi:hypothetical protein